jgi:hypothetical protein
VAHLFGCCCCCVRCHFLSLIRGGVYLYTLTGSRVQKRLDDGPDELATFTSMYTEEMKGGGVVIVRSASIRSSAIST